MESWVQQIVVPLAVAVLTSSGLWALVSKRADKNDAERKMLVGLAHDRIIHLCMVYVTRWYITQDNPIPAERGMEYVYGLYYSDSEDGKLYLCQRTGESAGGTVVLQYMPHELVGQYFEAVS